MTTPETPPLRCHLTGNTNKADVAELDYLRVRVGTLSTAFTEMAEQRDAMAAQLDATLTENVTLRAQVKVLANLAATTGVAP